MIEILLSGIFGALSSLLGKITMSPTTPVVDYLLYLCELQLPFIAESYCWYISYSVRFSCFLLMFYTNALTFAYFFKSLETRGSLAVTVVSSATNFLTTGLLSGVILGERITQKWILGSLIIACGVFLISLSQGESKRAE